ncbi:tumor necrosis factor receptor superfamily member 16-like isoform X2 [Sycon ciliatum]
MQGHASVTEPVLNSKVVLLVLLHYFVISGNSAPTTQGPATTATPSGTLLCPQGYGKWFQVNATYFVCQPCVDGHNYSAVADATSKCQPCHSESLKCEPHEFILPCTATSPAVCSSCHSGMYINQLLSACIGCTDSCSADQIETTRCTDKSNRYCAKKPFIPLWSPDVEPQQISSPSASVPTTADFVTKNFALTPKTESPADPDSLGLSAGLIGGLSGGGGALLIIIVFILVLAIYSQKHPTREAVVDPGPKVTTIAVCQGVDPYR